mmetsp:Transcript_11108/g.16670  ORF Transcript_11108/g.16670 Transcript_11108/m.16670 type:complete len:345 (-) Transcript_11108:29-1063(-)
MDQYLNNNNDDVKLNNRTTQSCATLIDASVQDIKQIIGSLNPSLRAYIRLVELYSQALYFLVQLKSLTITSSTFSSSSSTQYLENSTKIARQLLSVVYQIEYGFDGIHSTLKSIVDQLKKLAHLHFTTGDTSKTHTPSMSDDGDDSTSAVVDFVKTFMVPKIDWHVLLVEHTIKMPYAVIECPSNDQGNQPKQVHQFHAVLPLQVQVEAVVYHTDAIVLGDDQPRNTHIGIQVIFPDQKSSKLWSVEAKDVSPLSPLRYQISKRLAISMHEYASSNEPTTLQVRIVRLFTPTKGQLDVDQAATDQLPLSDATTQQRIWRNAIKPQGVLGISKFSQLSVQLKSCD